MADLGDGLRAYLIGRPAVAALLGDRLRTDVLDQADVLPAAVYYLISGVEEQSLQERLELTHQRVQIDAYAETRRAANALANAIRDALAAGRGTWGSVFVCGVSVAGGLRYDTQMKADGSNRRQYISSRDYLVSFQDT